MKDISPAELIVLKLLWVQSPMTASEIVSDLSSKHEWQDKTIKTLLNRLVNKQAIGFEKQGRAYSYFPLLEQSVYQKKESRSFIERIFGGKLAPLVAGFASDNKLNAADINELQQIIDQWKKEQQK
ncbi:BlaI/MecI/CopY family transcriptional regulator [Parashewanella spongiae]|uniref:BlaI/MecI/CopY family transcriptional regulator n=1 Tax=Parashewanella spongiae TaxID=342950 RepID=A0A3A6TAS6_9GAMM|nr:BlaI/MecI/CopY family transcriptional regulator [Parashewanella spongiae]MCL1080087.1 BlaI/MecI/CopY family transcriptional regulator [Parashewanella spongiae]RJY05097.1 BlaI/MecI/CopY family transcriptional regulator [Parashewanella spongiae]